MPTLHYFWIPFKLTWHSPNFCDFSVSCTPALYDCIWKIWDHIPGQYQSHFTAAVPFPNPQTELLAKNLSQIYQVREPHRHSRTSSSSRIHPCCNGRTSKIPTSCGAMLRFHCCAATPAPTTQSICYQGRPRNVHKPVCSSLSNLIPAALANSSSSSSSVATANSVNRTNSASES